MSIARSNDPSNPDALLMRNLLGEGEPLPFVPSTKDDPSPGHYFRLFGTAGQELGGFYDRSGLRIAPDVTGTDTPPPGASYVVLTYMQPLCDPSVAPPQCFPGNQLDPNFGNHNYQFFYRIVPINQAGEATLSEKNNRSFPVIHTLQVIMNEQQRLRTP